MYASEKDSKRIGTCYFLGELKQKGSREEARNAQARHALGSVGLEKPAPFESNFGRRNQDSLFHVGGVYRACGAMSGEGRVGMAGEERAARPAPRNPDTFFLVQTSCRLDRARSSC